MSDYHTHPIALAIESENNRPASDRRSHYSRAYRFKTVTLSNQEIDAQYSDETLEHPYSHLADTHDETLDASEPIDALDIQLRVTRERITLTSEQAKQLQFRLSLYHRDLQNRLHALSDEIAREYDVTYPRYFSRRNVA